ncbi:MAG: penicillin-binding protein 1A, partial [bacterium]
KVLFLTSEKTLVRKLKEAVLAINIERRYSKEEILHMYLNQIYLGEGAYGVEAAARTYFAKSVSELNLAESAMIAGLPRSPSTYSPISHTDRALMRMRVVLKRLLDEGYITEAKFQEASEGFFLNLAVSAGDPAPYFTELVRQQLEELISPNLLYRGGLRIDTTLNRQMQAAAIRAMEVGLAAYEKRHSVPFDSDPVQVALLALDPASGEIKALIGGRDFISSPFNRAVQAKRQPGSAFKPILYAAALSSGFTPAEIVSDTPQEIFLPGQPDPWIPVNYSGKYSGPVTIRTALEKSLNAASVDLLMRMGYQPVIDTALKLGITTALKPYPSLALGTFDVTLKELVSAYGVFANRGIHAKPKLIRRVFDREGRMIWESPSSLTDVLSPMVAYQMTNLLEGVIQRGTGRRARILARPAAGKTGTTDDYRDAWFVGYVPGLVSGVWVGYDLPRTLGEGEAGSMVALPIWIEFMKGALKGIPPADFLVAEGIELAEVDPATGLLAGPLCPNRVVEAFLPGT